MWKHKSCKKKVIVSAPSTLCSSAFSSAIMTGWNKTCFKHIFYDNCLINTTAGMQYTVYAKQTQEFDFHAYIWWALEGWKVKSLFSKSRVKARRHLGFSQLLFVLCSTSSSKLSFCKAFFFSLFHLPTTTQEARWNRQEAAEVWSIIFERSGSRADWVCGLGCWPERNSVNEDRSQQGYRR